MVSAHPLKLLLIFALAMLSCGLLTPASDAPVPAPAIDTLTAPTEIPPPAALTVDMIRNAQYQPGASDNHTVVQLVDGQFVRGADPAAVDYVSVYVSDIIALGDIDGDEVDEAAAVVFENFGGTGNFAMLTLYKNDKGLPLFVTSTMIDDRPIINELAFQDNEIFLDATVHGIQDPACCAALPSTRRFALVNNRLRLTNLTTSTPGGQPRVIEITAPANGAEAAGSVQVTGNVSIAPFENNLAVRIYDASGVELSAGPMMVTAPDLGAPGTFDSIIELDIVPAGARVFLEVQDLSAADGSLIAMDSVQLAVK